MLDVSVLAELTDEADMFAAFVRSARCCDALEPCHKCWILRRDVAARRRAVGVPDDHLFLLIPQTRESLEPRLRLVAESAEAFEPASAGAATAVCLAG